MRNFVSVGLSAVVFAALTVACSSSDSGSSDGTAGSTSSTGGTSSSKGGSTSSTGGTTSSTGGTTSTTGGAAGSTAGAAGTSTTGGAGGTTGKGGSAGAAAGAGGGSAGKAGSGTGGTGAAGKAGAAGAGGSGPLDCSMDPTTFGFGPDCDTCLLAQCCAEITACEADGTCGGCLSGTGACDSSTDPLLAALDMCAASKSAANATCAKSCGAVSAECKNIPAAPPTKGMCATDKMMFACNPVSNEGCNTAAGEACDVSMNGFHCYTKAEGPNDKLLCEACDNNTTFCAGGLRCVNTGDIANPAQECAKYCCDDTDCGGGKCDHTYLGFPTGFDAVGVCVFVVGSGTGGAGGAGGSAGTGGSGTAGAAGSGTAGAGGAGTAGGGAGGATAGNSGSAGAGGLSSRLRSDSAPFLSRGTGQFRFGLEVSSTRGSSRPPEHAVVADPPEVVMKKSTIVICCLGVMTLVSACGADGSEPKSTEREVARAEEAVLGSCYVDTADVSLACSGSQQCALSHHAPTMPVHAGGQCPRSHDVNFTSTGRYGAGSEDTVTVLMSGTATSYRGINRCSPVVVTLWGCAKDRCGAADWGQALDIQTFQPTLGPLSLKQPCSYGTYIWQDWFPTGFRQFYVAVQATADYGDVDSQVSFSGGLCTSPGGSCDGQTASMYGQGCCNQAGCTFGICNLGQMPRLRVKPGHFQLRCIAPLAAGTKSEMTARHTQRRVPRRTAASK